MDPSPVIALLDDLGKEHSIEPLPQGDAAAAALHATQKSAQEVCLPGQPCWQQVGRTISAEPRVAAC